MDQELRDFEQELKGEFVLFVDFATAGLQQIAVDTHEKLIARTPVDTGLLRASWIVTLSEGVRQVRRKKSGRGRRGTVLFSESAAAEESRKTQAALDSLQSPFEDIFITNPQDYASYLEEGSTLQRGRKPGKRPDTDSAGDGGVQAYNMAALTIVEMQDRAYVIGDDTP